MSALRACSERRPATPRACSSSGGSFERGAQHRPAHAGRRAAASRPRGSRSRSSSSFAVGDEQRDARDRRLLARAGERADRDDAGHRWVIAPRVGDRAEPRAEMIGIEHARPLRRCAARTVDLRAVPARGEAGLIERFFELDAGADVSERDQHVSRDERITRASSSTISAHSSSIAARAGADDAGEREKPVDSDSWRWWRTVTPASRSRSAQASPSSTSGSKPAVTTIAGAAPRDVWPEPRRCRLAVVVAVQVVVAEPVHHRLASAGSPRRSDRSTATSASGRRSG